MRVTAKAVPSLRNGIYDVLEYQDQSECNIIVDQTYERIFSCFKLSSAIREDKKLAEKHNRPAS